MRKRMQFNWTVWVWNFNHDKLEEYDVGSRFIDCFKRMKPKSRPKTREEIEAWLDREARYDFWAKCEYEMVIQGWPIQKNSMKVDVYEQLRLNWNIFVDKFIEAVSK